MSIPFEALFKQACWLHTRFIIARYLMSISHGRWSGAEKAQRHMELCNFYVAAVHGIADADQAFDLREEEYHAVHAATQELTDRLDETIDFPVDDPHPDYDLYEQRFFEAFHRIALAALCPTACPVCGEGTLEVQFKKGCPGELEHYCNRCGTLFRPVPCSAPAVA